MRRALKITPSAKAQIQAIMHNPAQKGLQKQLKKALGYLQENPRHPSLRSHLLQRSETALGVKTWTSYVQNNTPSAHRILWTYGPGKNEITILAVIPHY